MSSMNVHDEDALTKKSHFFIASFVSCPISVLTALVPLALPIVKRYCGISR